MRYYPIFRQKKIYFTLLILVLFFSFTVHAIPDEQTMTLLDRFIGSWLGKGKLMGAEAEFLMTWEWTLEHKFVKLTFQNKIRRSEGMDRLFKEHAFYKPEETGHFSGTWFDSRGMVLPLIAKIELDTLTTNWGSPDTEEGRTVYRLLDQNKIEVEDFVLKNGKWSRFGKAVYHRTAEE